MTVSEHLFGLTAVGLPGGGLRGPGSTFLLACALWWFKGKKD
jgi:hypothetical protein